MQYEITCGDITAEHSWFSQCYTMLLCDHKQSKCNEVNHLRLFHLLVRIQGTTTVLF